MKKILILGVNGYIGHHLSKRIIDTTEWEVSFSREVEINGTRTVVDNIKISRGEKNIFIWCFFLAIMEFVAAIIRCTSRWT